MLQHDPALEGVACVIFDEFHERNLQGDLGLALALECRRHLRPDLRLLVMSATLDGAALAGAIGDAVVVRAPGRMFDVVTTHVTAPATTAGRSPAVAQPVANLIQRALVGARRRRARVPAGRRRNPSRRRGARDGIARGALQPVAAVRRLDGRGPGCGAATGPAWPPQGRDRDQHRRNEPDDRRRAHRDRRRARATPALRSGDRDEPARDGAHLARVGRPAPRSRRAHGSRRLLPIVERVGARVAVAAGAGGDPRGRSRAARTRARLLGKSRSGEP